MTEEFDVSQMKKTPDLKNYLETGAHDPAWGTAVEESGPLTQKSLGLNPHSYTSSLCLSSVVLGKLFNLSVKWYLIRKVVARI